MVKKFAAILVFITICLVGSVSLAATPYHYCFIGDSRFVGMQQMADTDEDILWIAEVGAGAGWYWDNHYIVSELDRDTVIIYELGVNDLDAGACIKALQDLENIGFRHIYFTSVTPVDEAKCAQYGYTVRNYQIEEFNQIVRKNLPYNVASMDSYEYLLAMGFGTEDGVHYTGYTYQTWLYNILNSL